MHAHTQTRKANILFCLKVTHNVFVFGIVSVMIERQTFAYFCPDSFVVVTGAIQLQVEHPPKQVS